MRVEVCILYLLIPLPCSGKHFTPCNTAVMAVVVGSKSSETHNTCSVNNIVSSFIGKTTSENIFEDRRGRRQLDTSSSLNRFCVSS